MHGGTDPHRSLDSSAPDLSSADNISLISNQSDMEAIQQISNESFSHGNWLNNNTKRFLEESLSRSFNALDAASFIEMDLDFFSMRWADSLDFNFSRPSGGDASLAAAAAAMNVADQIFFNGRLLPLHLVNQGPIASPDSVLLRPSKSSPCQSESDFSAYSDSAMTPGRFGNKERAMSPAKILKKYLYFLVPLCRKVKKLRIISSSKAPRRFDCSSRRSWGRRMSNVGLTADDRRWPANRAFDVEAASSIHDAVLHCKKSNGNSLANSR
ncbi:hypothetical protein KSP40_PGU013348 [Platanthera guangdongensis]|uniref:Membrane-associated kinase regulator 6 n=1 Tax=Platanthera guangdongensis TaxID=2320717 RepID=A0ABR2M1N7_9ASPA